MVCKGFSPERRVCVYLKDEDDEDAEDHPHHHPPDAQPASQAGSGVEERTSFPAGSGKEAAWLRRGEEGRSLAAPPARATFLGFFRIPAA